MAYQMREAATTERLVRAIKARLVMTHGAKSPYLIMPIPIRPVPAHDDGLNWELQLDDATGVGPDDGLQAVQTAAAGVAHSMNLRQH